MKTKVKFTICGSEYTIAAQEPAEYIYQVADYVDRKMKDLIASSGNMSVVAIGTLTAVNLCDELFKAQQTADHLRGQLKKYLDDAQSASREVDELKKEVEELRRKLLEAQKG